MSKQPIFILHKPNDENGNGTWVFNQGGKITSFIKAGSTIIPIKNGGKK